MLNYHTDWKVRLLTQLLDCGANDIEMLKDCQYDINAICESLLEDGIRPTLENILHYIFEEARMQLRYAVHNRICDIEHETYSRDLTEDELDELYLLRSLKPNEDVIWEVNYSCSCLYLKRREEYLCVLESEIREIEENCGFEFFDGV